MLSEEAINWSSFPTDTGRCAGQDEVISACAQISSGEYIESFWAEAQHSTTAQKHALACFMVVMYRHTNQQCISVGVDGGSGRILPFTFEFDDQTILFDLISKLSTHLDSAESSGSNNIQSIIPTTVFFEDNEVKRSVTSGISLFLLKRASSLDLKLIFDGHQFRSDRINHILEQTAELIKYSNGSMELKVLEYSLITATARLMLPDPSTEIQVPSYPVLTDEFRRICNIHPSNDAIRHEGKTWSYATLDASSAKLGRYLLARGVSSIDVVAVIGRRSFGVVSSILAVFHSGAVLLTIDPKLPVERKSAMLRQASVRYLICVDSEINFDASSLQIVQVHPLTGGCLDESDFTETGVILPVLNPAGAAYIFFTSGSTGTPKGVVGTHRGLAHFLNWQRETFDIGPGDRAAQITSLSFDMVLRDIFLALTSGATLCIPVDEDILNPTAILKWMDGEAITVIHVVPSLLRAWVNNAPQDLTLPLLRRVFLAGEPLTDSLVESFRSSLSDKALVTNFYGPTETTLIKCFHSVIDIERGNQPIGRPQPQTQVLVLNRLGTLCGLYEVGQLAIRTPFRTLGYLNAPDSTASVFIQNPFKQTAGDLIYLTGDNGYYRADGLLVLLGRIDGQVKIRGMRVEPGEIEAIAGQCHGVAEVAVVVKESLDGAKYLAAYVVFRRTGAGTSSTGSLSEVREYIRAHLPENMVPARFTELDSLPLLANGKVDKRLLTNEVSQNIEQSAESFDRESPTSQRESELLAIWQSALGHSKVGVNDSFIELGGDSLTAISALVRMQRLGIPDTFARGIFQGWSIRQISSLSEGNFSSDVDKTLTTKARTNLLVNILRGLLVIIVVTGHWFEGFLNRLPLAVRGAQELLLPVFSAATPGFAILFGLGLGYIYYPKYLKERIQTIRSLRFAIFIVLIGILVRSASDISLLAMSNSLNDSTDFFNTFYSALLYYAIALAFAPVWFFIVSKAKNSYASILVMLISCLLFHQISLELLLSNEQVGFTQLVRLMLVAKFNVFNMSIGTLSGMAAGIYLYRLTDRNIPLQKLTSRLIPTGIIGCIIGLLILYASTGSLLGIRDESILPLWKWIFYAGTLLLLAAILIMVLVKYENLNPVTRISFNLLGVLGQISLPVFVLHQLVLRIKALLVFAGIHELVALAIPLLSFFLFCGWMMNRLYSLYYGSIGSPHIQPFIEAK